MALRPVYVLVQLGPVKLPGITGYVSVVPYHTPLIEKHAIAFGRCLDFQQVHQCFNLQPPTKVEPDLTVE
ncbi:hypothetical protein MTR_1g114410 [Medicago truncatula]|uniref:Uncharacterized protein n=1 Tax=Medicago truncatula TaxID=3880 RepID=G7IE95_MEDTR|nr:hypothetical protein MTR_1g114410 [Medicago truncatula]